MTSSISASARGALLAALVVLGAAPALANDRAAAPSCAVPPELTRIDQPLERVASRIVLGEPITIVAVGSSSTAGAGASSPDKSYPARLEAFLKQRLPGHAIRVLNRGVNGEDAREMLARFEASVIAEKPDLVLWQVGTNAVLREFALTGEAPLIADGVRQLKATGADVVLIDSQFAPKVIVKPDHDDMVALVAATAKRHKAGVFQRFAVMRHWHHVAGITFERTLSPDGLHMNDWSYDCIGQLMAGAIADAARMPAVSAARPAARP